MRVLHINNMNQFAGIYQREFTRRGHTLTVYEPSFVGGLAPLPIKLALMPVRLLAFRNLISKLSPDYFEIAHIHWASYGILGLVGRIPFVVHCRGDDVRSRLKHPLFRPILTTILRRAAAVMCSTPDLLAVVQVVRPDAFFSPAPVDTNRFIPEKDSHSTLPQVWTILLFARLDPDKGVDIATEAIMRFIQAHPNIRVRLLDWGTLRKKYTARFSHLFEFVPLVPPDKVQDLIHSANVVVGQLALGALGLSELQAMSCAKPVIASFHYDEVYDTSPPICRASTSEEVYNHLEYLFQYPGAATKLGQCGREWVIDHHDYRNLSNELEKLYRSILEHTHPSGLLLCGQGE